jgi:hypothetical protein
MFEPREAEAVSPESVFFEIERSHRNWKLPQLCKQVERTANEVLSAEGRLLAARVRIGGASGAHPEIVRREVELTESIRALGLDIGADDPDREGPPTSPARVMTCLARRRVWSGLRGLAEVAETMPPCSSSGGSSGAVRKLPAEFARSIDDPAQLRALVEDAERELIPRLVDQEGRMRLCRLSSCAGPFSDASIELGPKNRPSSCTDRTRRARATLRAVSGLLYGIPERTTDDHLHPMRDLRIGGSFARRQGISDRTPQASQNSLVSAAGSH